MKLKKITGYKKQYSIEELKNILNSYNYIKNRNENNYNGEPVYKITDIDKLPNENFRPYPNNPNIEVSNLGRIKIDNCIQKQEEEDLGYLYVCKYPVYRFVAETWFQPQRPIDEINKDDKLEVHHITNNGHDNRPENLIWVTCEEHREIDPNPGKRKKDLKNTFYFLLDNAINFEDNENSMKIFKDIILIGNRNNEKDKKQIENYISKIRKIKQINIEEYNLEDLLWKKWKIKI